MDSDGREHAEAERDDYDGNSSKVFHGARLQIAPPRKTLRFFANKRGKKKPRLVTGLKSLPPLEKSPAEAGLSRKIVGRAGRYGRSSGSPKPMMSGEIRDASGCMSRRPAITALVRHKGMCVPLTSPGACARCAAPPPDPLQPKSSVCHGVGGHVRRQRHDHHFK
jgi:hypothetical protein